MKRTAIFTIALLLAGTFSMTASAQKACKVAMCVEQEPFAFYNEEGELTGIDVDIVKLIAEEEEYELIFLPVAQKDVIPMVENGEADFGVSALTITTEEREEALENEEISFTIPYLSLFKEDGEYVQQGLFQELLADHNYAIAVSKKREGYLDQLNDRLAMLKETGELDKILEKYIIMEVEEEK